MAPTKGKTTNKILPMIGKIADNIKGKITLFRYCENCSILLILIGLNYF
jgi:hypothetical protein